MGEPVKLDQNALGMAVQEVRRAVTGHMREDSAMAAAEAAIRAYIHYAEAPEETGNVLGALVGLQRHRCDDEAVKTWSGKAEELIRHLLVQLGGRGASVLGRATEP